MKKFDLGDKIPKMEQFAHRYMVETFTAAAIIIGAISAWGHFFFGTFAWSILFLVIGAVFGLFWAHPADRLIKRMYAFSSGQNKAMLVVFECVKILIALFIPFIYFALVGVMAGTAYQYYIRTTHSDRQ